MEANKLTRTRLISRMKDIFGDDQRRIDHAMNVLKCAEEIHAGEGGSKLVVQAAAVLHDIGIHEAERKYGSSAGRYQEIEGPPIAKKILEEIGLDEPMIEHICRIVGSHHSASDIDTLEFRILWDADWLVNFPEMFARLNETKRQERINKVFKTSTGKQKAQSLFTAPGGDSGTAATE